MSQVPYTGALTEPDMGECIKVGGARIKRSGAAIRSLACYSYGSDTCAYSIGSACKCASDSEKEWQHLIGGIFRLACINL